MPRWWRRQLSHMDNLVFCEKEKKIQEQLELEAALVSQKVTMVAGVVSEVAKEGVGVLQQERAPMLEPTSNPGLANMKQIPLELSGAVAELA